MQQMNKQTEHKVMTLTGVCLAIGAIVAFAIYLQGCGGDTVIQTPSTTSTTLTKTGQWEDLGGPIGGLGYDVRIHPTNKNIMYVSDNYAGVGYSTNAGAKWQRINSGIDIKTGESRDSVPIFSLTIDHNDPSIIWVGTDADMGDYGVYKSTNGGQTWTKKINGITLGTATGLTFRGFTMQTGNSNVVYAQAETKTGISGQMFERVGGRVYKTTDGGDNWTKIWEGDSLARYLIIDPQDSNTLYVSTGIFDREAANSNCAAGTNGGVGVLKSTDGGATWSQINNGLTDLYVGSLRMHPTNNQILFAATGNDSCSGSAINDFTLSGLFKTTNAGASWTRVIANDEMTTVRVSDLNPNIVYAGSYFAFYRSTDGGETFTKYDKGSATVWGPTGIIGGFPIDMTIDPDDANTIYVNSYGGGVFKSTDGGQTWRTWSDGFTGSLINDVHVPDYSSSNVLLGGRSGPFASSDYGSSWTGLMNFPANENEWWAISSHPTNSSIILLANRGQSVVFVRSTDGGGSFSAVNIASGGDNIIVGDFEFAAANPNIVYAGLSYWDFNASHYTTLNPSGTVLYKSTDAGANWTALTSGITSTSVAELITKPTDANTVYAGTSKGVYKSTDGGATWARFDSLGAKIIRSMAIDFSGTQPYILAGEADGGVWISSNDGTTWSGPNNTGLNNAMPFVSALAMDPENTNNIYLGDSYSGVYKSTDKGLTWAPFPNSSMTGLVNRCVKDIDISKDVIYVTTKGGGIFRYVR